MSDENINTLGFFYFLYYPYPDKDRVKAYLDGDPQYQYFSYKEMEDLFKDQPNYMVHGMRESLMHMTGFLWDVAEKRIIKLNPTFDFINFKEALDMRDKAEAKKNMESTPGPAESYWKKDITEQRGKVQINVGR
jgi:hypothetical protein